MSSTQQLLLGEGAVNIIPNYIEEVFSTYLWEGNGSTQTITNGIDLSTKGGLVWIKGRSGATGHRLTDTARGVTKSLASNSNAAEATESTGLTAFNTTGFTIGADADYNTSSATYVGWTFREQAKFFDIVTWTGNDVAGRTISHNLGSTPGCIIIKELTVGATSWATYHRGLADPTGETLRLNTTDAVGASGFWAYTAPTSSTFTISSSDQVNGSGQSYVAYLFAHNAGGFGPTETDNVISCGSFTTDAGGLATVNLGYEPQWVLFKATNAVGAWYIVDTMRGLVTGPAVSSQAFLYPNTTGAEGVGTGIGVLSTGFDTSWFANQTLVYIAIRRGPMKVPTVGTNVFNAIARTGTGAAATVTTGNLPDWVLIKGTTTGTDGNNYSRLTGPNRQLYTDLTLQEIDQTAAYGVTSFLNTAFTLGLSANNENGSGVSLINYAFSRAPSFFDEVCYTGTGSATTFSHNLAAVPELMIVKRRSAANAWAVYANNDNTDYLVLNTTAATADDNTYWNDTSPTSSVFSVGTNNAVNASASTYVAYLFATCAGVSKVGSYTGNGSTQTIDCGFGAGGARFVLLKRTDDTGAWYVYDTVRGMTVLTDPYLRLNTANAQVATLGSVTTVSTGFALDSTILADINVSAGSYIFLAIA